MVSIKIYLWNIMKYYWMQLLHNIAIRIATVCKEFKFAAKHSAGFILGRGLATYQY